MTEERERDATEPSRDVQIAIVPELGKWLVKYKDQDRVCVDQASVRRIAIQLAYESGKTAALLGWFCKAGMAKC